jgi:hypothetical protein
MGNTSSDEIMDHDGTTDPTDYQVEDVLVCIADGHGLKQGELYSAQAVARRKGRGRVVTTVTVSAHFKVIEVSAVLRARACRGRAARAVTRRASGSWRQSDRPELRAANRIVTGAAKRSRLRRERRQLSLSRAKGHARDRPAIHARLTLRPRDLHSPRRVHGAKYGR